MILQNQIIPTIFASANRKSRLEKCEKTRNSFLRIANIAKLAQLVEHDLAKVGVAGSSPVFRSDATGVAFFCLNKNYCLRTWWNW